MEESSEYHFIIWNVAKYKSLMRGVSEGFYDTPEVLDNESCLDQEAIDAMYNMVSGWTHGTSFGDVFLKVSSAFYVFINNLARNCRIYQFFYDSVTYCFRSDQCDSFDIYVYNLGVNLWPISLHILQIFQTLIFMRNPQTLHEVHKKWLTIGN